MTAPTWTLHEGDMRDVLPSMPDCHFDAVVCDPPYELGFMCKQWDSTGIAFRAETWAELLRVLKPGAHLVAFGGSRTFHHMACAIEDAGFEIRDTLMWLYGSGFPKSLNVSKAIDKRRDDLADIRRVTAFVRIGRDRAGVSNADIDAAFGTNGMAGHWTSVASQPAVPQWDQWLALKSLLRLSDEMDDEVRRLNARKGEPGEAWDVRPITGSVEAWRDRTNYAMASRDGLRRDIPATLEAEQWQGWGTALKPGYEPIILARKPLIGTVAQNVLAHGCGGLNIDGCRVPGVFESGWSKSGSKASENIAMSGPNYARDPRPDNPAGRWPATVLHDGSDEVEAAFAAFGESKSRAGMRNNHNQGDDGWSGSFRCGPVYSGYQDSGTASRFFARCPIDEGEHLRFRYCAKASKADRAGSRHPTVKPLSLMRWLVTLVTPRGGTVLDPFAGSGTTLQAAIECGFRATGIEMTAEYVEDIRRRLAA